MELAATKFVRIDGARVTVAVTSAEEARLAVKELRHKKREIVVMRRALLRQKRAAKALAARARPRASRKQGWWSRLGSGLAILTALPFAYGRASQIMDLPRIEQDCARLEELQHSLDACLLQIEGKLIHDG